MKLIFVFAIVLIQIVLFYFFKVVEIVRAFWIYTFVNTEEFMVFLSSQSIATMRADKAERCSNNFAATESLAADFALVLTITAVVIINVVMRGTT